MELKESSTNPTKTKVDVAIEQIIAMEESADEKHYLEDSKKKDKMEGESRRNAQDCYGDNGKNTEEKVRGGAEQSKEMQKKWE